MNKFDSRMMTFWGSLILICLVFLIIVWHAFSYLPKDTSNSFEQYEELAQQETVSNENEEKTAEQADEDFSEEDIDEPVISSKPKNNLEIILDNELIENNGKKDNTNQNLLEKARELKSNKNYSEAIEEYNKIITSSDDAKLKAICYEEAAIIYALNKRYGSALSNAQRAYNMAPTSSREILLARLYYKTGDVEKATLRMNNVLKRDFGEYD